LLAAALTALLAACDDERTRSAASPTPANGTFVESACMMPLPAGQQEGDVKCGFVTVAQDPADSDGALEKLAVAILAATGTGPQPDPLLIVNGGPGIPTLSVAMQAFTKEFAQPLQSRRDLVFFDQRGTGLSTPSLDCPEQRARYRELLSTSEGIDFEGLFACSERLQLAGVNLSDYTSAAIARDMVDVMKALGYDQWNVYGWSYGTRIALTALRDTPDSIRSVVLDSTVPLEVDVQSSVPQSFGSALTALFEDCAANPACDAAVPGMSLDTLRSARAKLDAEPVVVEVDDPLGGKATVHITEICFENSC
jgi:pimeloyl-ACP methyl ester carboxylesterase